MTTPEQLETRMLRDHAAVRDEQLAQAQENAAYSEGASPNQAKMFRCEWRKYAGARAE